MRPLILAFAAAFFLVLPPAAHALPICRDRSGDPIRCGAPGAMPVGWTPSQQLLDRQMSSPSGAIPNELLVAICLIGGLFALIALMPDFDGWRADDWDEQEGDDAARRNHALNHGDGPWS